MKTRYAITNINKDGLRILSFANQGRNHFDSREDAESWLSAMRGDMRSLRVVLGEQVDTLRVDAVECYDHGDAVRTVFENQKERP
jgi:hypothetical protein